MSDEVLISLKRSAVYQHFVKAFGNEAGQYYPYANAQSTVVGYIVRWNMVRQENGPLKKEFRPFIRAHADSQTFIALQRKLLRFAQDHGEVIKSTRMTFPSELSISDRALDNWEPLLAVANLAGSQWMDKALQAAAHLSGHEKEALPVGTELLSDIEKVFKEKTLFKIHTVDLISALCDDEESPWAMYNARGQDKRLTPRQLSRLLAPYHIHSRNIEIAGIQRKGFDRHTFVEAWERYH